MYLGGKDDKVSGTQSCTIYCPALPASSSLLACPSLLGHQGYPDQLSSWWMLDYLKLVDYLLLSKGSQACSLEVFCYITPRQQQVNKLS